MYSPFPKLLSKDSTKPSIRNAQKARRKNKKWSIDIDQDIPEPTFLGRDYWRGLRQVELKICTELHRFIEISAQRHASNFSENRRKWLYEDLRSYNVQPTKDQEEIKFKVHGVGAEFLVKKFMQAQKFITNNFSDEPSFFPFSTKEGDRKNSLLLIYKGRTIEILHD